MKRNDDTNQSYRAFWEKFCTEKYPTILEMARYLTGGDEDRALDIAQTVVFRLLKYAPRPAGVANIEGYVFRAAQNAFKDSLRAVNDLNQPAPEEKNEPSQPFTLEPRLLAALRSDKNLEALAMTKDPQLRATQELRAQGFTFPQIASQLGEPVRRTRYRWYAYQAMLKRKK